MLLRRLLLQIVALAVFAMALIWMSGSGAALQSTSAQADSVYNQLHSNLNVIADRLYADTVRIDATGESDGIQTDSEELPDTRETLFKNIKIFNRMAYQIKNRYMEDIDSKDLIHAGIHDAL